MALNVTTDDRLAACWHIQNCYSCIHSTHRCGWCPYSSACVPAGSILEPISKGSVCPVSSERYELRTKALGCGCSTTTLLSIVVTIFATIAALVVLYGIGLLIRSLNPFLGTGNAAGWEIEIKEDGSRHQHGWYRGGLKKWLRSIYTPKPDLSEQSEQHAVTDRSRLLG